MRIENFGDAARYVSTYIGIMFRQLSYWLSLWLLLPAGLWAADVKTPVQASLNQLSPEQQRKFDYFYYEAANLKNAGKYDAAYDLFSYCLSLDTASSPVLYELAMFQLQRNRPEKAVEMLKSAVAHSDDNFTYRMTLAGLYRNLGMYGEASDSYEELVKRMSALYQKAMDYPYVDENGVKRAKFVNLDMEEYKDAHFTLRLFKEVLNKPEFKNYSAGIVVQAYLPDAYEFQTELLDFARERVARGGAPVKMRLVKGCNLEMETVISSLRGWPNPVRTSKTEVDANYLHILERALQPGNAKVLHVGVASHNLFTIAYAYLLSQKLGTPNRPILPPLA